MEGGRKGILNLQQVSPTLIVSEGEADFERGFQQANDEYSIIYHAQL